MRVVIVGLGVLLAGCNSPRDGQTSSKTSAVESPPYPATPDGAALQALDAESRAAVLRAPVAVMVPRKPELLKVGKVLAEANWYAFNATHDGLTVNVGASRIVHRYDDIAPAKGKHDVRGVPGFVTRNEGIWSAAWRENGVYYSLDVECAEPSDARCDSDALVLELARDLVFVGGAK